MMLKSGSNLEAQSPYLNKERRTLAQARADIETLTNDRSRGKLKKLLARLDMRK
jgi:hypothetical protein